MIALLVKHALADQRQYRSLRLKIFFHLEPGDPSQEDRRNDE